MADTWSYSAGGYGVTVRVYERSPGSVLYISVPDGQGSYVRRSLEHRDRDEAMSEADETAAALRRQTDRIRRGEITLSGLIALYERHHVPGLSDQHAEATKRRLAMWSRFLGGSFDPHELTRHDWQSFTDARMSGRTDAKGRPRQKPEPVRPVTVTRDLEALRALCRWGSTWRTRGGRTLLSEDPTRGLAYPKDPNPRRPVASRARYERLQKVSDQVMTKRLWGPKPERHRPSDLSEILDIVVGTGRRIAAVCALRYEDVDLDMSEMRPWGAIRWPADTDKMGRESTVPIGPLTRKAIERVMAERPGIGPGYLFPAASDPEKPCPVATADRWLREAEEKAGLETQDGGLWHPYRRMWATERKHHPAVDIARAGGWQDVQTLQRSYLRDDEETTLRVVLNGPAGPEEGSETG